VEVAGAFQNHASLTVGGEMDEGWIWVSERSTAPSVVHHRARRSVNIVLFSYRFACCP
jgi:hypothetical protein